VITVPSMIGRPREQQLDNVRQRVLHHRVARREHGVDGRLAQARQVGVAAADLGRELAPERRGRVGAAQAQAGRVALGDGRAEQPAAARRDHVQIDRRAARALAKQRHLLRVAAERGRVALHPVQRRLLVEEAGVRLHAGHREEAQRAQPVVDHHHDRVGAVGQHAAVVQRAAGRALQERTARHEHHHRQQLVACSIACTARSSSSSGRHEHVEVQAVLALRLGTQTER
jgi:hypothetical protein